MSPGTKTETESGWTAVLTPEIPLLHFPWAELWRYRDLIVLMVQRDFVSAYKQTILGPLWHLLQPLFTTVVFTVIFGKVAGVSTDGTPSFLFYLLGTTAWGYFADCLLKSSRALGVNSRIISKVYFPRLAIPISSVISSLVAFGIQLAAFLAFYAFFWARGAVFHPDWHLLVLPLLCLQMAALGLGVGCIVSAATTRYQDLAMLVAFGTQLWMYGSSVVIPLSVIPEKYRLLFILNPMVPVIESFRFIFFGTGIIELWQLAVSLAISLLILFAGLMLFQRVERNCVDTL